MKKNTILAIFILAIFTGCAKEDNFKKNDSCPNLGKKNETQEEINIAKKIENDLDKYIPRLKPIYIEALRNYNKTSNPELYINIESLELLSNESIWVELIKKSDNENEYKKIASLINKENSNWCKFDIKNNTDKEM